MSLVSQKLRDSARGQECTLRLPGVCRHDAAYTVLCHIRDNNAGIGEKPDDWVAMFGCDRCHEAIDQHKLHWTEELEAVFQAVQRTWRVWFELGLLRIAGDEKPPARKPRPSKIVKHHGFVRR